MLFDAAVLATLTTASLIFLYKKLPERVRQWLTKHPLFVDVFAMLLTLGALGTTVTALMAGAMVDAMLGVVMYIHAHPDDFLYLYDAWDAVKEQLASVKTSLNEYGANYRKSRVIDSQLGT